MKERERKIVTSLSSLGLVFLSLLGGRHLEKKPDMKLEKIREAHLEPQEPIIHIDTPVFTRTPELTPLPTYTPLKTYTQPTRKPTATKEIVTAQVIIANATSTTVPLVEIDEMTATQIIASVSDLK